MTPLRHSQMAALLFLTLAFRGLASPSDGTGQTSVEFGRDVQPILEGACVRCHGERRARGGLRLDGRGAILRGGDSGAVVSAGAPSASPLIVRIRSRDPELRMPPKGEPLSSREVAVLKAWVEQGAQTRNASEGEAAKHWSLEPLLRPLPPSIGNELGLSPVDAFILERLRTKGLTPAPPADRRTLLRRASYTLTGLPPSREEVERLIADDSPDAWARCIDRLLASPRYGEHMARRWIDIVHFAETHGHDEDAIRPNAWPYRDWLIGSFNEDRPWAQFIEQQVAGDILYREDPKASVATGFLAAGPWDQSSQLGIQDETLDKTKARYLDRDDMIQTTMSTFTSATVHCARCHDHEFDPISQEDYYSLQAVFAGVDRTDRPWDPDPTVHRERRALTTRIAKLHGAEASPVRLDSSERSAFLAWESAHRRQETTWVAMRPLDVATRQGSSFEVLEDRSVLFRGPRPDRDTYDIELEAPASFGDAPIASIRLEVLRHASLPQEGPGRQDNGNLHLSEIDFAHAVGGQDRALPIAGAFADFDQTGWTIEHALDREAKTAWGIFPQVGRSHQAVFRFAEPLQHLGKRRLRASLHQLHGGGHLIGRLRFSASTRAVDTVTPWLDDDVRAFLATPAAARSPCEQQRLERAWLMRHLAGRLRALPKPHSVYAVTTDFEPKGNFRPARGPREVHVLHRGDVRQPGDLAQPGALSCIEGLPSRFELAHPVDEGERRAALARWLTDERNVLTWRSAANRIWQVGFGQGLVTTPNDFGRAGARPSHPELLDWLACELRDKGGSIKSLLRTLLTSRTWQQTSRQSAEHALLDADNRFLWRMPRSRISAESLRDSVLVWSGALDLRMGGPSSRQFESRKGLHVTPIVDYAAIDPKHPANHRRSVYRFLFRTLPDPFFDAWDCPDASLLSPQRTDSVTAVQALSMLHHPLQVELSRRIAQRIEAHQGTTAARVGSLFRLLLQRSPDDLEARLVSRYADRHGFANACRMVLNHNELLYLD